MGRRDRQNSTSLTFRFAIVVGATIQVFFFGLTLTHWQGDYHDNHWSQRPNALPDRVNTPQDELPLNTPQDQLPLETALKEARARTETWVRALEEALRTSKLTEEEARKEAEARDRALKERKARDRAAPDFVNEGAPVMCHGHIDRSSVYRYTGGELRPYPSEGVASSWDPTWGKFVKRIDCVNIPKGAPMSWNYGR